MMRPTFTVTWKRPEDGMETNFDAGMVHCNFDGTITFICSGTPVTKPAKEVTIAFQAEGAGWCQTCDQSIAQFSRA